MHKSYSYAVGSVNVRLTTVKAYAKLAMYAGVIPIGEYAMIKTVGGYRHAEGRNLDATRATTRKSTKKAASVTLTSARPRNSSSSPTRPKGVVTRVCWACCSIMGCVLANCRAHRRRA